MAISLVCRVRLLLIAAALSHTIISMPLRSPMHVIALSIVMAWCVHGAPMASRDSPTAPAPGQEPDATLQPAVTALHPTPEDTCSSAACVGGVYGLTGDACACPANCLSCRFDLPSGSMLCAVCANNMLLINGACVSSCPSGYAPRGKYQYNRQCVLATTGTPSNQGPSPTSLPTTTPRPPSTPALPCFESAAVDLVIAIDASGSLGLAGFTAAQALASSIVNMLPVGANQTK